MSNLAQSGYGRGNKIDDALQENLVAGVIVSPRDEKRERLEESLRSWRLAYPSAMLLFDPQFYVSILNSPKDSHLGEYEYYSKNCALGRTSFSGALIQRYVRDCVSYQREDLGESVSSIISPTVFFDDFRDNWSQIAINMAVESVEHHATIGESRPLIISLVINETAFLSVDAVEEFLDAITELEVHGFYLTVRRNTTSLQSAMEPAAFSRLLYFCYVLAEINQYEVLVGYSDWHSFILKSVGVSFTAAGWYQNLRQFTLQRFQPSTGGRRPRKRYSSAPLLTTPLIVPELEDAFLAGVLHKILSGSNFDDILSNGPAAGEGSWKDDKACLAHWHSLNMLSNLVLSGDSVVDRLSIVEQIIKNSLHLYAELAARGVNLEMQTGPNHILDWQDGIRQFRGLAGI